MTHVVNIQAVTVPNPDALKFIADGLLLSRKSYDFNAENAAASPLADKLFGLGYVTRVFIAGNFITVTKSQSESPAWEEAMGDIRILIRRHLENGEPVLHGDAIPLSGGEPEDETGQLIRDILEDRIAPATFGDGGEIIFESYREGVLRVSLHGACMDCPFAPRTIRHGIEKIVREAVPDLISVESDDVDWTQTQQEE